MAAPSDAAFVGVKAVGKPNAFGLWVCNVYAEFDNPGNDWMQAVAGTPGTPLNLTVVGGTFYNHAFGGDKAPGTALVAVFPSLAFDSFYTIGMKAVVTGVVDVTTLVNMPVLAGSVVSTTNGSWAVVPPTDAQGNPFDAVNSFPGNGQILIGQFSAVQTTALVGIQGSFLMQYISDGVVTSSVAGFEHFVPTPGALGLLGAAGLIGFRRRRR
ncbi:MAG: hypothetical protein ACYSU7_12595 [Planctomycetota bacterium]|jgi:hypothetical protein